MNDINPTNDIVPAIEALNLSRHYGRIPALKNIDLAIPKDRIVALLGPNGAGKTTLLHLLMGMLAPTSGHSSILGIESRALCLASKQLVGYMADGEEPPGWMTLKQLMAVQAGASHQFDRALIKALLPQQKLMAGQPFGALSKGQKKWLRAALLLAARPQVLLLDEPAEGLDPTARHDFYDYLRRYITESGTTALVATHIIGDIERIADDAAIIQHGKLLMHASLEDLREQVREIFLPTPVLPPELSGHLELIGKKPQSGGTLFWVRCQDIDDEKLKAALGQHTSIQHSNLETLYRAMTDHDRPAPLASNGVAQ